MAKVTRIKASDGPRETEASDDKTVVRKRVSVKDKKTEKTERAKRREAEKSISVENPVQGKANAKLNKKVVQSENTTKAKKPGKTEKTEKSAKNGKKPFILFRPFVALGHYLRDSWHELRQVRWPNRKATWKMLIAVIVYSVLFMVLITVLDLAFSGLFNLMFSK